MTNWIGVFRESAIFTDIEEYFNSDEMRVVMFILNIYNSKKQSYEIGQLNVIRQFNEIVKTEYIISNV